MCSRRAHWLAGLLALSFCTASPAWGQSPVVPPLASRMVSVGGYAMRVQTAGLDTRLADQPIVVFQNGGGSSLETWGAVPARISEFAPVVVYDRNTVGESEWDGEIGTPAQVTERLWHLLAAVGAAPPYVLVGWSWGGDLIRYHAGLHPEAVAGLVHIDPAGYSPGSELQLLAAIGSGEEALQAMEDFEGQASGTGELDRRREAEGASSSGGRGMTRNCC